MTSQITNLAKFEVNFGSYIKPDRVAHFQSESWTSNLRYLTSILPKEMKKTEEGEKEEQKRRNIWVSVLHFVVKKKRQIEEFKYSALYNAYHQY